jgi:hypothetical protein
VAGDRRHGAEFLGRCTGPITAILPEGRHESSPGWSEAQPWDSVPKHVLAPRRRRGEGFHHCSLCSCNCPGQLGLRHRTLPTR